ncbi:hypothetical protein L6452_15250 [Arctium lappa]|uniref:Uncharacterized protein n=1 Tax=Arctium lappa TaxID=4217 RepID=A0ACB9CNF6_ARCLA|nr:hypothetical protein L6452_15250 [Arctium lappa]
MRSGRPNLISKQPFFSRESVLISSAVLRGFFSFSRESTGVTIGKKSVVTECRCYKNRATDMKDLFLPIALCVGMAGSDMCKEVPEFENDDVQDGGELPTLAGTEARNSSFL